MAAERIVIVGASPAGLSTACSYRGRDGRDGATVGVLTHNRDEDYERGRERVAAGAPLP
jgi:2-polyprenyl-6-methoxyphenol hydroxylase-like FAD-dependent oxidoreductase